MESKRRMLVVDDAAINREALKGIFNDEFDIIEAKNGADALSLIKGCKQSVSIILLDILMPVMDGYEFLAHRQKDDVLSAIPVVAITSVEGTETELAALKAGADDIIARTADSAVIRQRVKNVVLCLEGQAARLENRYLRRQSQAQIQLKAMMDHIAGGVALVEAGVNLKPLYLNHGFYELLGYDPEDANPVADFRECIRSKDWPTVFMDWPNAKPGDSVVAQEVEAIRGDGSYIWLDAKGTCIEFLESPLPVVLMMLTDISKLKASQEALRLKAEYDPLTGVYNRESFYEKTGEMLHDHPDMAYYILRWNIEKFKIINDLFGRQVGDAVLCRVSSNMRAIFGEVGTFGRVSADNFVACIPEYALDLTKLSPETINDLSGLEIEYSLKIDVGVYPIEDIDLPVDQMCDRAKLALDTINGDYLKCFAYYDDTFRNTMMQEQEIISEMDEALARGEFCVYYQPIYNAITNKITSAEALVRWNHPTKGMIPPGKFIPLFERNGFITRLDAFVWEAVCAFISGRLKAGLPVVPVSVNVSRKDLFSPHLVHFLVNLVERYDIGSELLKIEITESAYTDDPHQMMTIIKHFKEHGFRLLMDDFGSGYSSLNMLKDTEVDILKIDMKFLEDIETSKRAGNVITSVVRMAKWLDMETVAEGVETKNQLDFLRNIGCDQIQGYYYSKPLPEADFSKKLSRLTVNTGPATNTLKRLDMDALLNPSEETNIILNEMLGAMGFFELSNGKLDIIRVNRGFEALLEVSQMPVAHRFNLQKNFSPRDYLRLVAACEKAKNSQKIIRCEVRRQSDGEAQSWIEVKVRFIGMAGMNPLFYFAMEDITQRRP